MDKTYKLLVQMFDVALELRHPMEDAYCNYVDAKDEYERLGTEADFLISKNDSAADWLEADMTDAVDAASDYLQQTIDSIADFDRNLAKLIMLRGRLAEEAGIPMMSHLGTKGFGRKSAAFLM